MKTILQIAREIGVSKQAVYKRFKGKLHTDILPYIHMQDGTIYILEQGENIIKSDFLKDSEVSVGAHTGVDTERIQDIQTDTAVNTLIQMLQRELELKNKQIEELTATIKIQAESINAAHHNELAETIIDGRQNEISKLSTDKKKNSFFSRLFSKWGQ